MLAARLVGVVVADAEAGAGVAVGYLTFSKAFNICCCCGVRPNVDE